MASTASAPIGVFDSGVGGLSVLRHIRAQLPHEHLLYFADAAFAPYGDKPEQAVAERSLAIAGFLISHGAKALVVACNTATVAAIKALRARYPAMPIVGVEPGLKPGAAASRNGIVGVLATDGTLAGEKFQLLLDQIGHSGDAGFAPDLAPRFLLQACTGLASQIELGELDSAATAAMLARYITPLLDGGADTLVLGCTHYPLAQAAIERLIANITPREVVLVDTGQAVARQLARLLAAAGADRPQDGQPALLQAYTSASATALQAAFSALLGLAVPVQSVEIGKNSADAA